MAHETHDRAKHRADAKAKITRLLADPKGAKIDASGYSPPDVMRTGEQVQPYPPKARAFKKGGKVEGPKAHHHSGRKRREAGGQMQPPINVPTGGLYGNATNAPTHAGMAGTLAGLKKGGKVKHRDAGGYSAGPRDVRFGRASTAHDLPTAYTSDQSPEREVDEHGIPQGSGGDWTYDDQYKKGGKVGPNGQNPKIHDGLKAKDRVARKEGGRAKGKTNINIIIAAPKGNEASQSPPGMPPGAPQHPGMGGFPPPSMPGGGPPQPVGGAMPQGGLPPAMMGGGK
jgi:hypothetical protein